MQSSNNRSMDTTYFWRQRRPPERVWSSHWLLSLSANKKNHTNKTKRFCISSGKQQLRAQENRQVTHPLKLHPRCIASCSIPGTATQDLPHPPSHREQHLLQNGRAAFLLKQRAGDAPTTESLQKRRKAWKRCSNGALTPKVRAHCAGANAERDILARDV